MNITQELLTGLFSAKNRERKREYTTVSLSLLMRLGLCRALKFDPFLFLLLGSPDVARRRDMIGQTKDFISTAFV